MEFPYPSDEQAKSVNLKGQINIETFVPIMPDPLEQFEGTTDTRSGIFASYRRKAAGNRGILGKDRRDAEKGRLRGGGGSLERTRLYAQFPC